MSGITVFQVRFFFDFDDQGELEEDLLGTECADEQSARDQAVATLAAIAADFLPADGSERLLAILVRRGSEPAFYRAELRFSEYPATWAGSNGRSNTAPIAKPQATPGR